MMHDVIRKVGRSIMTQDVLQRLVAPLRCTMYYNHWSLHYDARCSKKGWWLHYDPGCTAKVGCSVMTQDVQVTKVGRSFMTQDVKTKYPSVWVFSFFLFLLPLSLCLSPFLDFISRPNKCSFHSCVTRKIIRMSS